MDFFTELKNFAPRYQPFPWDSHEADYRKEFRNKNCLVTELVRYAKVLQEVSKVWRGGTVVDFGIFPGIIPYLFQQYFPYTKYFGVGLMFSPEFVAAMKKMNVELLESELDPSYFSPRKVNPVPWQDADLVLFMDIIEHLTSPVYALDAANRCLKKNGYLILTTDNITSFDHVVPMLRGRTPLLHPIQTNMFYVGEWRPHFREYGKEDLIWILENSGFQMIDHEYFDRRQAEYSLIDGKVVRDPSVDPDVAFIPKVKTHIYRGLKTMASAVGHFRSHQILVVKKRYEISELKNKRPDAQHTLEGWGQIRKEYLKGGGC